MRFAGGQRGSVGGKLVELPGRGGCIFWRVERIEGSRGGLSVSLRQPFQGRGRVRGLIRAVRLETGRGQHLAEPSALLRGCGRRRAICAAGVALLPEDGETHGGRRQRACQRRTRRQIMWHGRPAAAQRALLRLLRVMADVTSEGRVLEISRDAVGDMHVRCIGLKRARVQRAQR